MDGEKAHERWVKRRAHARTHQSLLTASQPQRSRSAPVLPW
jgi:hypothetical protein